MKYVGLLLFCAFAATTARPTENLELLLRELLKQFGDSGLEERGIGAVKFGGTHVGEDFIEVKVIRHMDEVKADVKSHKPLYSIIYGEGQHDPNSVEHALDSKTWSELDKCQNGAEGCIMIKHLSPNTMYWIQFEVQMYVNGAYQYIKDKKDVEQIKTKGREPNAP